MMGEQRRDESPQVSEQPSEVREGVVAEPWELRLLCYAHALDEVTVNRKGLRSVVEPVLNYPERMTNMEPDEAVTASTVALRPGCNTAIPGRLPLFDRLWCDQDYAAADAGLTLTGVRVEMMAGGDP